MPNDKDLIAVPLSALQSCCDFRVPALVETSIPFHAQPFRYEGEIRQAQTQLSFTPIFQIPAGMTGAITGLAFTEQYVGIFAGTKISILINGEAHPEFPRFGHNLGLGPGFPGPAHIFLKESDQVGIFMDCPWTPINFTSAAEIEYGISFVIVGYYLDKEVFCATQDNMEVGLIDPRKSPSCADHLL